jgi:hypothetical protein
MNRRLLICTFAIIAILIIIFLITAMPKKEAPSISPEKFSAFKTLVQNRAQGREPSPLYNEGIVYTLQGEFKIVFYAQDPSGKHQPFFDTIQIEELSGLKSSFTLRDAFGKITVMTADKDLSNEKIATVVDKILGTVE